MPDKLRPNWLSGDGSLDEYNVESVELSKYTVHISSVEDCRSIYDDCTLETIQSELLVNVQIYNEDESDLFFTLNPKKMNGDRSYTSAQTIKDSQGCTILTKPDWEDSYCDICSDSIPKGSRMMAFTGGTVSSEMHCSCWQELIDIITRVLEDNSEKAVSHMI